MSSDKENMPPTESVTPPSLRNLSLEKEVDDDNNEATLWEANVARKLITTPRASLSFPKQTSTLEDLEPDMDKDIIDVTDYSERLSIDKRSPRPKQMDMTQGHCPHTSKQPHIFCHECYSSGTCQTPHKLRSGGSSQTKEKYPMDDQHV